MSDADGRFAEGRFRSGTSFAIGDAVKIKHGNGPEMTVEDMYGDRVLVVWFAPQQFGWQLCRETFNSGALQVARSEVKA